MLLESHPENEPQYVEPTTEEDQEPSPKESGVGVRFFHTFTFQVILCLSAAIILVLLNTFFPVQYADLSTEMKSMVQNDNGFKSDVKSVWNTVSDFLSQGSGSDSELSSLPAAADSSGVDILSDDNDDTGSVSADQSESSDGSTEEISAAGGEPSEYSDIIPTNASIDVVDYQKKLIFPLDAEKRVTSEYGIRTHPITRELNFHTGVDLAADEGTDIYAAGSGTVIAASLGETLGYYIKIKHEDSNVSLYAHCSELYVKEGDKVKQGDTIAAVGSTGMSTGPHLHLAFFYNGKYVDPVYIFEDVGA